jgi:type IV pilus assembly protein PilY1
MTYNKILRLFAQTTTISGFFCMGMIALVFQDGAYAGTVAQNPLFLTQPVKPNIMLMMDNSGSMNNIVPDLPYDSAQAGLNCPAASQIPPCTGYGCVQIRINAGIPSIFDGSDDPFRIRGPVYSLGTGPGQRCFSPTGIYSALLVADNRGNTAPNLSTGDAEYTGHFLNWYFDPANTGVWVGAQKPGTRTRLEIAKTSAKSLVDSLQFVRLGLSTYYNNEDGGALLETVDDIDEVASKKTDIKDKVDALRPENNTPLAETLLDIGHYFATGYTGDLTLHPGESNQSSASVDDVFTQGGVSGHSLNGSRGKPNPVQHSCQQNFAILMTDGRPNMDRSFNNYLYDYTGDCAAGLCDATPTGTTPNIPTTPLTDTSFKNGTKVGRTYEWGGSDYLDDVAQALFEMDLRPDLAKSDAIQKNNLKTYAIGFADPVLANDPLLRGAAQLGGGQFIPAGNSAELNAAFQRIMADINNQVVEASASSLAANSSFLDTNTRIYQAGFNSTNWTGSVSAFKLGTAHEDQNNNGVLDSGEDTNANGKLDDLGLPIKPAEWTTTVPAAATRRILSFNPALTSVTKGISFEWAFLSTAQKTAMDSAAVSAGSSKVLDYIRGDQSQEKPSGPYRKRDSVLGDIVNSDPLYVSNIDDFGNSLIDGAEGTSYNLFRRNKSTRTNMLYVGGNDGMLHGFNADTGAELFAYVPNAVLPSLKNLTDPNYGCKKSGCIAHQYFVDGSPRHGDAYFGIGSTSPTWHTVLLGTTGAGNAKAIFALDVTSPSSTLGEDKVLWELSPSQAGASTDIVNNLGYTLPQPLLVRLNNGRWAAVVANGYNSASQKAVLFIIDVATGAIIRTLDTLNGSSTTPNGLSSPINVDVDGDRLTDYIYAGDLLGNLWKFDVSDTNAANWKVAFANGSSPAPLFTACSAASCTSTNLQAITAKPAIGRNPQGGFMVYFGTGKYFEAGDQIVPSSPQVQTLYALWDQGSVISGRGKLQEQTILAEGKVDTDNDNVNDVALRVTSDNAVDYIGIPTTSPPVEPKLGWYMDLMSPVSLKLGERVIVSAKLSNDAVRFRTVTPTSDACSSGGVSWFMDLDALTGKRFADAVFDVNGDSDVTANDSVRLDTNHDGVINNNDLLATVSGIRALDDQGRDLGMGKSDVSMVSHEGKVVHEFADNKKNVSRIIEKETKEVGRQSWREIR